MSKGLRWVTRTRAHLDRVKSAKRKSSVIRRYSDFAWLLECLLKQYPFRQIPLLPPKRLAGMNLTGIKIPTDKSSLGSSPAYR